jgi:hypothetical protein
MSKDVVRRSLSFMWNWDSVDLKSGKLARLLRSF